MTPTDSQTPSALGLLRRTLRRRWIPILTRGALLTTALMSAAYVLIDGPYQSQCLIRVDPANPPSSLNPATPATSNLPGVRAGGESTESFLRTQAELIAGASVLEGAAADPKVAALPGFKGLADPSARIREAIRVEVVPGTYLISVAARSSSPVEAATLVNAVVDSYLALDAQWSDGMTNTQIKNLESYLTDLRPVNRATPPARPIHNRPRLLAPLAIPFLTFAAVVGLFAAIEARSRPEAGPEVAEVGKDEPPAEG